MIASKDVPAGAMAMTATWTAPSMSIGETRKPVAGRVGWVLPRRKYAPPQLAFNIRSTEERVRYPHFWHAGVAGIWSIIQLEEMFKWEGSESQL